MLNVCPLVSASVPLLLAVFIPAVVFPSAHSPDELLQCRRYRQSVAKITFV